MRRARGIEVPDIGKVEDLPLSLVFGGFALNFAPRVPIWPIRLGRESMVHSRYSVFCVGSSGDCCIWGIVGVVAIRVGPADQGVVVGAFCADD